MSSRKPPPLIPRRRHEPCPVCGEISYSHTGVHPQCSVRQADAKRLERLKRERKAKTPPAVAISPWQRLCPKCKAVQHVRKKTCECGYNLSLARPQPPAGTIT